MINQKQDLKSNKAYVPVKQIDGKEVSGKLAKYF